MPVMLLKNIHIKNKITKLDQACAGENPALSEGEKKNWEGDNKQNKSKTKSRTGFQILTTWAVLKLHMQKINRKLKPQHLDPTHKNKYKYEEDADITKQWC